MADNTIGKGQRGVIPGLPNTSDVRPTRADDAQQIGNVAPRAIDAQELPRHEVLAQPAGPIRKLVDESLAKLGDSRYGGAATSTFQLLIGTLGASAAQVKSSEIADQAVRELRSTYASILRGAADVTPDRIRMIKDDAPALIKLAVQAMDDGKSSAQEIIDGARKMGESFAEVFAMTPQDRKAFIAKRREDMATERAQLSKGSVALEAAKINALDRIDAVTDILATLEKYVAFPQIPS
ncbi:MAG: hypothetical protein RMA76_22970 [Deltaproteobacteria bacterium]